MFLQTSGPSWLDGHTRRALEMSGYRYVLPCVPWEKDKQLIWKALASEFPAHDSTHAEQAGRKQQKRAGLGNTGLLAGNIDDTNIANPYLGGILVARKFQHRARARRNQPGDIE